jgi:hypothetical protein
MPKKKRNEGEMEKNDFLFFGFEISVLSFSKTRFISSYSSLDDTHSRRRRKTNKKSHRLALDSLSYISPWQLPTIIFVEFVYSRSWMEALGD